MAPETADLTELIARLRSAGFRVDPRQYLTAHELLFAYARRGKALLDDPAALASHLGPIFCTQAEEQDRFAGEVAAWRGTSGHKVVPGAREEVPFAFWRRWRGPLAIATLLTALVIGAGVALAYEYWEITLDGEVLIDRPGQDFVPARGARVRFRDGPVEVDDNGKFRIFTTRAAGFGALTAELEGYAPASLSVNADWVQPIPLHLRPLPPRQPSTQALRIGTARAVSLGAPAPEVRDGGTPWNAIAWRSVLTAMIAFMLLGGTTALRRHVARRQLEASTESRRQLALRRLEHAGGVDEITLAPPPASAIALNDFALRRVASAWRRPREQAIYELDAAATIDTTLRAGGLFAPVYTARRSSPEYLALVHRRSEDDHWARFAMEWLEKLMASGVAVDVFTFHDDPRTCYDIEERRRAYRLANLLAQHHRASVLLFAESRQCFAPATEMLEGWVHMFAALPRRVLFTPEVPYRWGYRESTLATEGFVVLPGNAEGFRLFGELSPDWKIERLFPAPYARAFPRMLADQPDRWLSRNEPPRDAIEKLVNQLRGYLGPDGFDWLCGCAVYPQIAWPLTLYLAGEADTSADPRSKGRTPLIDTLPALGRLPWLRHGFMPDWLRRTLIAQMSSEQNAIVRRGIESLLEEIALSAARVDSAKRKSPQGGILSINRWIGPADLLGAAPPGSPLSDRVFLGFMSGTNVDPLSMSVKGSLLALFRRDVGSFDAARAGRQAARAALTRFRTLAAFHPFASAGTASVFAGLLAAAILWRSLPHELVPALPDAGPSFSVFSPDGQWLVVRDATGQAVLIDLIERAPATSTRRLGSVVQSVADQIEPVTKVLRADGVKATAATFSADGSTVIVGYGDSSQRRFKVPSGLEISISFAAPGRDTILALGARADGVMILVMPNGIIFADPSSETPRDVTGYVAASFDAEVRQAAIAFTGGQVRIFDLQASALVERRVSYDCPAAPAPLLSPNGNLLACADLDGVLVWEVPRDGPGPSKPSGFALSTAAPASAPTSFAFSPDSRILAVVRSTREIEFWDVADKRVLARAQLAGERPARAAAFNAKGDTFVAAGPVDVELFSVNDSGSGSRGGDFSGPASDIVPSLLRMTVNAARSALERHQLAVGNAQTRASSATKGTIIAQRPAARSRVAVGTTVDVTLSDGSLVRVPNLVGLQIDAAEKTLAAAGLVASRQDADSTAQPNTVIAQQPAAGTEVAASYGVTVTVARRSANPAQQAVPQVNPTVRPAAKN